MNKLNEARAAANGEQSREKELRLKESSREKPAQETVQK